MIEIGAQVDLSHPPERVWHVLTDPGLLAQWFTEAEVLPARRGRLRLNTARLPGFDAAVEAEVIEHRVPESITLRCHEAGRRTRLSCVIIPTARGCQLSLREIPEHGAWATEQHLRREQCYQQALTGRLPAILDWLAFQQVDLRRGEAGMTAELPVTEAFENAPAGRGRRPTLIAASAGAVLIAGGLAVWSALPAEPEQTAGAEPAPSPTIVSATDLPPQATAATRPTPTVSPSATRPTRTPTPTPRRPSASAPLPARPIAAHYETVATRVFGYTGEVVVENPDEAERKGWTVVVTLAEGGTVASVSGAEWQQDGQTITFTGPPVPAGQTQTFRFEVRDADPFTKAPAGCAVGDKPCAGL